MYSRLVNGCMVYKSEEAINFGVNERTIQRDIDDIRNYLEQAAVDQGVVNEIVGEVFLQMYECICQRD